MPRITWTWILKLCIATAIAVSFGLIWAVLFVAGGGGYAWWRRRAAERQTESKSSWSKTPRKLEMNGYLKIWQAPLWLWAYAVTAIGEVVIVAIVKGSYLHFVLPLLAVMLLSLLLLSGIRAAWCFVVLLGATAVVVPVVRAGFRWQEACNLLQVGLLLTPASRRYVWQDEKISSWLRCQSIAWKNIGRLAAFVVATLILAAVLGDVRSEHPGLAIDALWAVAFSTYGLALIALLWLLLLAGAGWVARRIQPEGPR